MHECDKLKLVADSDGFGKKGVFEFNGRKFNLDEIRIPNNIVPPENLKDSNIPKYEPLDRMHYVASEILYFQDRQWLRGCEEHRQIPESEMNAEIAGGLELAFRWAYYEQWNNDSSKVRKLDDCS